MTFRNLAVVLMLAISTLSLQACKPATTEAASTQSAVSEASTTAPITQPAATNGSHDYDAEFEEFLVMLSFDDWGRIKPMFPKSEVFNRFKADIMTVDFVKAMGSKSYSDAEETTEDGIKVKVLEVTYKWEDDKNKLKGETTVYLSFQEAADGLKILSIVVPEGTDSN